ncbi:ABC transporter permease [Algoriphagus namhaensis]
MDTKKRYSPPKSADKFLEFYCSPSKLEQIQGDAYELFYRNLEERGLGYARFRFWIHVFCFFKWSNIKRSHNSELPSNPGAMFKNYLKIGWRNLRKQKLTTFISVFGLALAVACSLVAYLFMEQIWFKGMNQQNKEELYQLIYQVEEEQGKVRYGTLGEPAYESLKMSGLGIDGITRVSRQPQILIHQNETFNPRVQYVDADYMRMFSYAIQSGYSGALEDPNQIILSAEFAEKLFQDLPPIGQELSLIIQGEEKFFRVAAVLEPLKDIEIFDFEVLVHFDHYYRSGGQESSKESWKREFWTFVQVSDASALPELNQELDRVVKVQNFIEPDRKYEQIEAIPFTELVARASTIERGVIGFLGIGPQLLLGLIALFVLLLAVFNYINISILMASRRLREIGVRKVIGGKRVELISQFLTENFLVCLFAVVLGCLIAAAFFLPGFNAIAYKKLQLDLLGNWLIWIYLSALILFLTLVSGLYPAIYISSFQPLTILKGQRRLGSKSWFTNFLLAFQFTLAIISMVGGIAFLQTNHENLQREWGYDNQNKLLVHVPDDSQYAVLRNSFIGVAGVQSVAGSSNYLGNGQEKVIVDLSGEPLEVDLLRAEPNYPELMGLELNRGRFFTKGASSESMTSILVNETFVKESGIEEPLDFQLTIDSVNYTIIGVVDDFHNLFFQSAIEPMLIMPTGGDWNYMTLSVDPTSRSQVMSLVKSRWRELFPKDLFFGMWQEDVFETDIADAAGIQNILLFASLLCLILAAMGLYGLISLSLGARLKDYCVRKIYGAGNDSLAFGLFRAYLLLWAGSFLVGGTVAFYVVKGFLSSFFAFHAGIGLIPLGMSASVLLLVILVTGGVQFRKLKEANPAQILRTE